MKLTLKQKFAKYLFPELFQSREDILKNNRALGDSLRHQKKETEYFRQRAFSAEQALRKQENFADENRREHERNQEWIKLSPWGK